MSNDRKTGLAQTVLGSVKPDKLGITTTHEHLLIDFLAMFQIPLHATDRVKALEPLNIENLGWARYNPFRNRDNLTLLDESTTISEAKQFKLAGGGTIVDATTYGIGRNPLALTRISRSTGLHIVMGAGYYVDAVHPAGMDQKTEGELEAEIIEQITVGVDNTEIKAGIIGEIGCSWPLTSNERKVLCAAASAQSKTGASILIHPGRDAAAPKEILGVLSDSGADLTRVIIAHLDRTIDNISAVLEIAETGCYLEYDLFGWETSYYPISSMDMPNDAQRINFIVQLIEEGYVSKIVLAHDICFKTATTKYGGHGFAHILENIVPRMKEKGVTQDNIDQMLIENPKKLLTIL